MPIDNQLYTASFRGIKFLVNRSSVAGGRKTVTHEFIDSDRRFVQDQGLLNRTFTVNAIIHEVSYTYFAQRDNLLLALEEEGPGLLVHPFYGTQTVNVTSFTLDENTSSVGRADFNIVFEESQPNDSPTAITNNLSAILDLTNQVVGQVNADIATGYGVSSIYPNNFTDAENTLNNISSTFAVVTDQTMTDVEATEEFDQSVNEFSDDTTELVSDPTQLGSRLNDLWLQSNELVADPSDAVTYFQNYFDFGDDDTNINTNTLQKQERQTNRNLLNGSMQISSLALAYQNASLINYTTTDDIDNVRDILEAQYEKVFNNPSVSQNTKDFIGRLRSEITKFFQQEEIITSQQIQIFTNTIPIRVLTYKYYGSIDNTEPLINLNDIQDMSFVSGDVNIISEPS